jgi:hypothetical protein
MEFIRRFDLNYLIAEGAFQNGHNTPSLNNKALRCKKLNDSQTQAAVRHSKFYIKANKRSIENDLKSSESENKAFATES